MTSFVPSSWLCRAAGPFLLLLALGRPAQAQVDDYTFAASAGTFAPLVGGTNVANIQTDEAMSASIALPFTFSYDGSTYQSLRASSNGFLTFGSSTTPTPSNSLDAAAATIKPLVAPLWDNLTGGIAGNGSLASHAITGAAGSRVFTFEWLNWAFVGAGSGNGPQISFQARLYEGSNRIEFVYRQESNPRSGALLSIGLAGIGTPPNYLSLGDVSANPTASSVTANNNLPNAPATGQVYAFSPPSAIGCPPPRSLVISNVTGTTADISFRGSPATAQSYTVTFQAAGGPVQTISPNPTTASPIFLIGLQLNTTYTVTVTANCAGGATSATTTATFATANGYCTSVGGTCTGFSSRNVTAVRIFGTAFNATGLTCSGTTAAYTNYPAQVPNTGTLQQGVSYRLAVEMATAGAADAWVDYDGSRTFTANEYVRVITGGTQGSALLQVPLGATLGTTYMRVRSTTGGLVAGGACTNNFGGETKDFVVTIGAAPACLPPSNLTAAGITATGASLGFMAPAGGGTYTLVYGPTGFDPTVAGAGTVVAGAVSPVALAGLLPGTTYDFYVQRTCTGGAGQSTFTGPFSFTTAIVNDNPCGARALTLSAVCTPVATTTFGATTSTGTGINTTGCAGLFNNAPADVWFTVTTAATGPTRDALRINVTGGPAGGIQAFSAPSCNGPFSVVGCVTSGANNTASGPLDLGGLTASTTYYVRVFGFGTGVINNVQGAFTICAVPVPNCAEPVALMASALTGTSATLTWGSQPGTGQTFTVVYGPGTFNPATGGTRVTGITANTTTLTNLTPGTTYSFYVQRQCAGLNGASIFAGPASFTTPALAPANDEPCSAVALTVAQGTATGTTVGATNSTQAGLNIGNCSLARQPNDVWFSFVAGSTGTVTLTLNGTSTGAVRVFSAPACTGPFTSEQCQSSGTANTSVGTAQFAGLVPGTTYYAAVSGYAIGDAPGAFTISAAGVGVLGRRNAAAAAALEVYPNPSNTGYLTVRLSATPAATGQATLLNALGQRALQVPLRLANGEQALPTAGLAAGVYTLRVETNGRVITRKVVLE